MSDDNPLSGKPLPAERALFLFAELAKAVALALVVAILAFSFNDLRSGVSALAKKLPGLVRLSAFGVNLELDAANVDATVRYGPGASAYLKEEWGEKNSENAVRGLESLTDKELIRLMRLGDNAFIVKLCEKPTAEQLYELAIDKRLEEKKMVRLTPRLGSPKCACDTPAAAGTPMSPSARSAALECYEMKAEEPGHDVQTAVISSLEAAPTTAFRKAAAAASAVAPAR